LENIASSDSPYRHARLTELLTEAGRLTPEGAAAVLRNRYGMGGRDIGLTNEKSINQAIAHHAVIFQPVERRVWVSTAPWQAGAMLCYDLDEVFVAPADGQTRYDAMRTIAPDSAFLENDYPRVTAYRALSQRLQLQPDTSLVDSLVKLNPNYFGAYELAGDCYAAEGRTAEAVALWHEALECETARLSDRQKIEQKIQDYGKR
ncbi:MAG: choloylglycine hydrolase, partial [Alistipes sp.]|nr:choloylglycine hydrolase [Alistipes sp.]